MRTEIPIILFLLWCTLSAVSQSQINCGSYHVTHYGAETYQLHPRNFHVTQDRRKIVYVGNTYGVLEYDGTTWSQIEITNKNIAVSVGLGNNGIVYIGSNDELGFLAGNENGKSVYKSLRANINRKYIGEIHEMFPFQRKDYFCSDNGLYILDKAGKFNIISPEKMTNYFWFMKLLDDKVYISEEGAGLKILKNHKLYLVNGGEFFKDKLVKDIYNYDHIQKLIFIKNGIYIWHPSGKIRELNPAINLLLNKTKISKVLCINKNEYMIATHDLGVIVIDNQGNIKEQLSMKNGFPVNKVNFVYKDHLGGIWMALDKGILYLKKNIPFYNLSSQSGISGLGYTAAVYHNCIYVGTSQGLYYAPIKKDKNISNYTFKPISNIKGQICDLQIIENKLLCCQREHLYQIEQEGRALLLSGKYDDEGNWKIIPLKSKPGFAIKGTYHGFQLYQLIDNQWRFVKKIPGYSISSRLFLEDNNGTIWSCHPNLGVYKIVFSDDYTKVICFENINEKHRLSANFCNDVTLVDGDILFSTQEGIYTYDVFSNRLIKHKKFNQLINNQKPINKIIANEQAKSITVFTDSELILIRRDHNDQIHVEQNIFKKYKNQFVGHYEFSYPITESELLIGTQDGFVNCNLDKLLRVPVQFDVLIRKVETSQFSKDSILFGGMQSNNQVYSWPFSINAIRFNYTALNFDKPENNAYQYALIKNKHDVVQWSKWTNNTSVDYSNLYEGNYTFLVRAKNVFGELSNVGKFTFTIQTPWFRSVFAYVFYFSLFILLLYYVYYFVRHKFIVFQAQQKHELLLLEQKFKLEKLESDIIAKNNELSSLASALTQKNALLSQLKHQLQFIDKNTTTIDADDDLKKIIKTINIESDFDDNWTKFQLHFDELHQNFLHNLRQKYPKLNPNWLLFCAYIRMNKSNKEISTLMNISVAAVEKRKYRLREKLSIQTDEKFSDFIFKL